MTTPGEALSVLDGIRQEMDSLSISLHKVEQQLDPLSVQYEQFISDFEIGLWEQHVDGGKLPPATLRVQMAHRAMPPELYGRYTALAASSKRMQKRISTLKAQAEAQRSVLSALKEGVI